jgi:hypothetical protein
VFIGLVRDYESTEIVSVRSRAEDALDDVCDALGRSHWGCFAQVIRWEVDGDETLIASAERGQDGGITREVVG